MATVSFYNTTVTVKVTGTSLSTASSSIPAKGISLLGAGVTVVSTS